MSICSQLQKERDLILSGLANNERAKGKALTMREVASMTTMRINPNLSESRKSVLRAMNNKAATRDPIRIEESRKVLDEWVSEFNARARKLGYDSLAIQRDDHLHIMNAQPKREAR